MLQTKEHYDLLFQFEKEYKSEPLNREPKELWGKGAIYENGVVNNLFMAYRRGYALGKLNAQEA